MSEFLWLRPKQTQTDADSMVGFRRQILKHNKTFQSLLTPDWPSTFSWDETSKLIGGWVTGCQVSEFGHELICWKRADGPTSASMGVWRGV
jgi:hypothetical protein